MNIETVYKAMMKSAGDLDSPGNVLGTVGTGAASAIAAKAALPAAVGASSPAAPAFAVGALGFNIGRLGRSALTVGLAKMRAARAEKVTSAMKQTYDAWRAATGGKTGAPVPGSYAPGEGFIPDYKR